MAVIEELILAIEARDNSRAGLESARANVERISDLTRKINTELLSMTNNYQQRSAAEIKSRTAGIDKMVEEVETLRAGVTPASKAELMVAEAQVKANEQRIKAITDVAATMDLAKVKTMGFTDVMALQMNDWIRIHQANIKFTNIGGKVADVIRDTTHGMRRFKMEMLSVMFFGMGVARAFGQMTQAGIEAMGITEYFGVAMEVITLEALLPMSDAIFGLIDWLINLDPATQRVIGTFMIVGQVFGNVLFFIGSMMLGIGGLIMAFGSIPAGLLKILGTFGSMIGLGEEGFITLGTGAAQFMGVLGKLGDSVKGIVSFVAEWAGKTIKVIVDFAIDTASKIWTFFSSAGKWMLDKVKTAIDVVVDKVDSMVTWLFGEGTLASTAKLAIQIGVAFIILDLATRILGAVFEGIGGTLGRETDLGRVWINVGADMKEKGFLFFVFDAFFGGGEKAEVRKNLNIIINPYLAFGEVTSNFLKAAFEGKKVNPVEIPLKVMAEWTGSFADILRRIKNLFGFQEGGIVTKPTAGIVGESGPEAIIPLNKFGSMVGQTTITNIYVTPAISIDAKVNTDMDLRELAEKLNVYMVDDLKRQILR